MAKNSFKYIQVTFNQENCKQELEFLNKVENDVCKYSLFRALSELMQLVNTSNDFDIYNTRIWDKLDKEQNYYYKFSFSFNSNNEKEMALYDDIRKLMFIERKILLRNVIVHAGRKLIKAYNPNSDIEIKAVSLAPSMVGNSDV